MNPNLFFAQELVFFLAKRNVKQFFLAPGSRNSPLIYALLKNPQVSKVSHFDERGLAFLAIGYVKKTGNPAVILSTSGSAIAHFYPAILEAYYNQYPLLIITADRPMELQGIGSNQTIAQDNFFSHFVKHYNNFMVAGDQLEDYQWFQIKYGFDKLLEGPVHFNVQFKEPLLETTSRQIKKPFQANALDPAAYHLAMERPILPERFLMKIMDELLSAKFPFIVVGKLDPFKEKSAVLKLLQYLKIPVILDVASNLRGQGEILQELKNYSLLFKNVKLQKLLSSRIDFVLHLGGAVINKETQMILSSVKGIYYHVSDLELPFNPYLSIKKKLTFDVNDFSNQLLRKLTKKNFTKFFDSNSFDAFLNNYRVIEKHLMTSIKERLKKKFDELSIALIISEAKTGYQQLYLGNSMIIRDFDFMGFHGSCQSIFVNRGTSGIEGFIACALGCSLLGSRERTWLILGDLAFLHDLNSLTIIEREKINNLGIIVINNFEGTIFRNLPMNSFFDETEKKHAFYKHEFSFAKVADQFSIPYFFAKDIAQLLKALKVCQTLPSSFILELAVDPFVNQAMHESFFNGIREFVF